MITTAKRLHLRNEFNNETGIFWTNSHDEPDLDYVEWLEEKLLKRSDNSDYPTLKRHIIAERTRKNDATKRLPNRHS